MSELQKYLESLNKSCGELAVEATKEVIDKECLELFDNIKQGTPVNTGGLVASLTMSPKNEKGRYGHVIDYIGYNERGVAYSLIGRSLNKGVNGRTGTRHIDKAVRKLKGIDSRINKKFLEKLERRVK